MEEINQNYYFSGGKIQSNIPKIKIKPFFNPSSPPTPPIDTHKEGYKLVKVEGRKITRIGDSWDIAHLFGSLPFSQQRR